MAWMQTTSMGNQCYSQEFCGVNIGALSMPIADLEGSSPALPPR